MKQKILKSLYNTIESDLDGKTLLEAAKYLTELANGVYSEMDVVIEWSISNYSDDYELSLFERRDETDEEETSRELLEKARIKAVLERKKIQFEALKKELGEQS